MFYGFCPVSSSGEGGSGTDLTWAGLASSPLPQTGSELNIVPIVVIKCINL